MSAREEAALLVTEIRRSLAVLDRIELFYDEHAAPGESDEQRTTTRAIVIAETLVNYYTCLETVFFRISQYFENHLASDRSHTDLLDRMVLSIPNTRPRVIGDATHHALRELLRFRHFKRYYFEFDYDWDRLDFLRKKLSDARGSVRAELDAFIVALEAIAADS
ncbi:MAG: hypothetical protein EA382_00770 [Spirochaetaceae bacterium]|nr:MAG: hypothetical protein EA382_00770 [Spirochaetaceae bacterium]